MRLEFSPESQLDLMEIAAFIARDHPAPGPRHSECIS